MTEGDMAGFRDMMLGMSEIYRQEITKFGAQMWFDDLRKYTLDQIREAFSAHRRDRKNGQFMPKPSDIIRHIEGAPDELSTQAWSKLIGAIKSVGSYSSVCFDDPVIHACVSEMGGWSKVCELEINEIPFKQKEFERLYLSKTSDSAGKLVLNAPRYLPGVTELANTKMYQHVKPEIVFIGDAAKARQLLIESKQQSNSMQNSIQQSVARIASK